MKPKANTDRLLMEEIDGELVVYDRKLHHAHRLNEAAAAVWRQCDGTRSVAEVAALLRTEQGMPVDEEVGRLALADLDRAGLLQEPVPAAEAPKISRRQLLALVAGAGIALPVVESIVAPTPALALTILGPQP